MMFFGSLFLMQKLKYGTPEPAVKGGVWNFRRSTANYGSCEALSWHSCRSSQYPEMFSELWSYPIEKCFWPPGKSEKS